MTRLSKPQHAGIVNHPPSQAVTNSDVPDSSDLGTRLDGWKEIANYLQRSVNTAQRWEAHEGLPVRRLPHGRRGSVFAYSRELEKWAWERSTSGQEPAEQPVLRVVAGLRHSLKDRRIGLALMLPLVIAAAVAGWSLLDSSTGATGTSFRDDGPFGGVKLTSFAGRQDLFSRFPRQPPLALPAARRNEVRSQRGWRTAENRDPAEALAWQGSESAVRL
jgi:hypothetical protein